MKRVWISSSGVPMMPVVLTSSRQGGTPHLTKKFSEEASIHLLKLGKKTMPAGSQSPNITSTSYTTTLGSVLMRGSGRSAGGHAQGAVEADDLAVEVPVADDVASQFGELGRFAQPFGEGDAGRQRGLHGLGQLVHQGGGEQAGGHGAHPDAVLRQVAGHGQGHAGHTGLGRAVGLLAHLAVER